MSLPSPHRGLNVPTAMPEVLPPWEVLVLESHHADDFSMEVRSHEFLKIVYILEGGGRFDIGDETFVFTAGDAFVVPPGYANQIIDEPTAAVTLYAACIGPLILRCDPRLNERLQVQHLRGQASRGLDRRTLAIAATLRRMVFHQDRGHRECSIELITDAWRLIRHVLQISFALKPTDSLAASAIQDDDELIANYVESLRSGFVEATTIDAAADSLGLSRRTFTSLFRRATGTTWLRFVGRLRVEHAAGLLRQTDRSIPAVAFESGFADLSTFYRQFAKHMNCSPAAFRKNQR